jgi:hypothetical protein
MKTVLFSLIVLPVALLQARTFGQGQFLFNTLDLASNNRLAFTYEGMWASGSDLVLQVFAGPDIAHLIPLEPLLPLNQTGALVGFTNPTMQLFEVPGMPGGTAAIIRYGAFEGISWETASTRSYLGLSLDPVTLTKPPSNPNVVHLGVRVVPMGLPEPGTLTLGVI